MTGDNLAWLAGPCPAGVWRRVIDAEQPRCTDFETVTALYDFDRVLRRLVVRGTEHVEVALRGNWAYQLASLDHGHSYLDAGLYSERKQFHYKLAKLAKEVGESNETYIDHYRKTYRAPALPPVWMVAEMMSFGQLSRWYCRAASPCPGRSSSLRGCAGG